MLKSILFSLTLVCGIAADTTTWAYDAPYGCDSSVSFQSCVQPFTSATDCDSSDTPCSCSADDLDRSCSTKYCPAVEYTSSAWMADCANLGYSYINSEGDYITTPASAHATKTASTATETDASSSSATEASSSSHTSAQAGSATSASSPTSTASSTAGSKPNDAGRAVTFPTGGVLAILVTAAGAMAGMLML